MANREGIFGDVDVVDFSSYFFLFLFFVLFFFLSRNIMICKIIHKRERERERERDRAPSVNS